MSTTQPTVSQVYIDYPEMYTIKTNGGYSCLGFDVLETRYIRLHAELLELGIGGLNEFPEQRGTIARYHQYERLQRHARSFHDKTGYRFKCELTPQLIGLEDKRVELTYPTGEKTRFIVGKSTGWIPIHLEIKTKRSNGGGPVYYLKGTQLRIVG